MNHILRSTYFFVFLSFGSISPLLNLYFSRIGFSGTQIGIIASGQLLLSVFMQPVWGIISDRYRMRKRVFMLSSFACGFIILGNLFFKDFYTVFFIMLSLSLFQCSLVPILDSSVMLELKGRGEQYGTFRLFGSLGYAVAAAAIGFLADRTMIEIIFISYAFCILLTGFMSFKMPESYTDGGVVEFSHPAVLLKDKTFLIFLLVAFMSQASMVVSENFLGVYIDYLHGSSGVIGLAWMLAALSEIPVFYLTGNLIKKLGLRTVLIISLTLVFFRILLYGLSTTPLMVLVVHGISGLDYATFSAAAINFVSRHTPDSMKTTGQTIYTMVSSGIGGMVGNLIGGVIIDVYGLKSMFIFFSMVIFVSLIIFILFVKDNESRGERRNAV